MNKRTIIGTLVVLIIIIGAFLLFGEKEDPAKTDQVFTLSDSKEIAQNWISQQAPTYVFDGMDLTVEWEEEIDNNEHFFIFSFDSRAGGYGDRSEKMAIQVITPHTMEVVVKNGEVTKAITDGVYDEIQATMITETEEVLDEIDLIDEEIDELDSREDLMKIDLYFVEIIDGQEKLSRVERETLSTIETGRAALEALLNGPLPEEEDIGLSTAINPGVKLISLTIEDGVAKADFSQDLQEGIAGSAWVTMIREQIEKTLLQFDSVTEVIISIEGESEDILQP